MTTTAHLLRSEDKATFKSKCAALGLDHFEELPLQIAQTWAVGDRASSTDSPYAKNVFAGTSTNLIDRTQDPPLGIGNKLPGDSLLMIYAISAIVRLGNYGTTAQKKDTQNDLDRSKLQMRLGGARIIEAHAPQFMDYGPSMLAGNDGAGTPAPGFQPTQPRIVKVLEMPQFLGTEQTWQCDHFVGRTTDWGVAFVADYVFHALLGRKR